MSLDRTPVLVGVSQFVPGGSASVMACELPGLDEADEHGLTVTGGLPDAGVPERGIIIGRTEAGRRFLANTPEDPELLAALALTEAVGRRGRVEFRDGANCFVPS